MFASLPVGGDRLAGDASALLDLASECELAGFDGVVLADHVVIGADPTGFPGKTFPHSPDVPFFDPLALAAAVATRTTTLTVATGIVIAPLRPAAVLAKMAATIDHIAGGRFELGVGIGWQREEYDAVGVSYALRGELLTDHLRACRALWGDGPTTYASGYVDLDAVWCRPAPVRAGGPTVLVAGRLGRRTMERVVDLADGWIVMFGTAAAELETNVRTLHSAAAAAGREPAALIVRSDLGSSPERVPGDDLPALFAEASRLLDIGITDVVLRLGPLLGRAEPAPVLLSEAARRWGDLVRG